MKLYKLDTQIKAELLRNGLSIHHYVRRAYLSLRFIRSMNFDSAWIVKTVTLEVTSNKIVIPDEFVGVVRIGFQNGQRVESLAPDNTLISNTDVYTDDEETGTVYWYPNYNKYGENLGGYFGYSIASPNSYQILPEENKILINNELVTDGDEVVLQYITDGMALGRQDADGEIVSPIMYVHPYMIDALNAYIDWQLPNSDNRFVNREAKADYYNELRKWRARNNPLTADMIKNSLRRRTVASPKN